MDIGYSEDSVTEGYSKLFFKRFGGYRSDEGEESGEGEENISDDRGDSGDEDDDSEVNLAARPVWSVSSSQLPDLTPKTRSPTAQSFCIDYVTISNSVFAMFRGFLPMSALKSLVIESIRYPELRALIQDARNLSKLTFFVEDLPMPQRRGIVYLRKVVSFLKHIS